MEKLCVTRTIFPMPKIAIQMHFNVVSFFFTVFILIFFLLSLSLQRFHSLLFVVSFSLKRKKRGTDCFAHLYRENVSQSFRVASFFSLHIFHTHLVLFKFSTSIFTQYTFLLDFFFHPNHFR